MTNGLADIQSARLFINPINSNPFIILIHEVTAQPALAGLIRSRAGGVRRDSGNDGSSRI